MTNYQPDKPANEAERLLALRRYEILDTPSDRSFDRIVGLAARLLKMPIAIVSLVDEDRIWFKSRHGLEAKETTRDLGLCASAILHDRPWILADVRLDPHALANPLVAREHGFRFYAAAQLTTHDGFKLGTLCVIDYAPRSISGEEIAILQDLAALVMDEMELRLASRRALDSEALIHRQEHDLVAVHSQLQEEAKRRFAFEAAQIGDWDLNLSTNIGSYSALYAQCFGYQQLPPNWNFDLMITHVHPEDSARVRELFAEARKKVGVVEVECRVIWPDRSLHWVWWKGRFYLDQLTGHLHIAGVIREITTEKMNEQKISQLALMMEKITTPIMLTDADRRIVWFNHPFEVLSGYTLDEVRGCSPGSFMQGPGTDKGTIKIMHDALAKGQGFEVEVLNYHKSGRPIWQHLKVDPVRDDRGQVTSYIAVQSDITERKHFESLLWRNANFDPLTGLPNRRLFWDRLDNEVRHAERNGKLTGLFFIDLDRFKEINDLYGHEAGDLLLKEVAARIESCVRKTDTLARIGGDEFTLILSELENVNYAERIARKIIAALGQPFVISNACVNMSASIGIAIFPGDGIDGQELFKNADQAMYMAKSSGRNQFCYFTASMQQNSMRRLRTGLDLRSALGRKELRVFFQPVISLASGRIVKAEALLRWKHPTRGLVEPSEFIPLAEELGLINEIGEWVFHEAALWAKKFNSFSSQPFQVSVNKSPMQFGGRHAEISWPEQLKAMQLPCQSLSVEITEGVLLKDCRMSIDTLRNYRSAGIEVALDDFGTGYSSMAYLVKFGIDYLKIDQSFVKNMGVDVNRTIAETIIVMGHKLGMRIIAEGIETPEQMRLLIDAGCDFGQGYLFSEPLPPEEFEQVLSARPQYLDRARINA